MENGKIPLQKCPKCKCLGTDEVRRYWDLDRDLTEDILVSLWKCQGCGHTWEIILDRKPKNQPEEASSE